MIEILQKNNRAYRPKYKPRCDIEHHICDIIAQRMKHRKSSWSTNGAEHLAKILTSKVCQTLYDKFTSFSRILSPEKYTQEINGILSAAKAPNKEKKGYQYPTTGRIPFMDVCLTNGRKAIQNMMRERSITDISYK